eukprot:TRINITY_DN8274_c0_g1_i1.p1 TRINITY_DN8274_c0_g1~~TRINITY_DN8274_c0_g1_i1.p1  ORF type:complete len:470 (+),score=153.20 TRINITY_DN8274_c0_g1_i1:209-1618(+)
MVLTNFIIDIVLWSLSAILIYFYLKFTANKKSNQPPVVEGGGIIFGKVGMYRSDPINFAFENQKKYGNIFVVQGIFGLFKTYFVMGEEAINMVLKAPDEKFNFKKGIVKFVRAIFGEQKEEPKEEESDVNNRISRGIKKSQKMNQMNIESSMEEVLSRYSKIQFDFNEMVEELIFKINVSSLLGKEAMKDFKEIKETLSGVEHYGLKFTSMFFPNLPFGTSKKTRDLKKKAVELLRPYIIKKRESKEELEDYLSIWAQSPHVAGSQKGENYTDEEITNQIIAIIIAAHLNTAVSMTYILIYMFRHPEHLEKLRKELWEMKENEEDLYSSALVTQTIREVMRLSNTGSFIRRIEEDTYYEGYLLEKGTLISSSIAAIHYDQNIFKDPFSFKPDRWEDPNLMKYAFWFGSGLHRCKGDGYALQILRNIVVEFALNWDLEFKNQNASDFEIDFKNNRRPKGNIISTLKRRTN